MYCLECILCYILLLGFETVVVVAITLFGFGSLCWLLRQEAPLWYFRYFPLLPLTRHKQIRAFGYLLRAAVPLQTLWTHTATAVMLLVDSALNLSEFLSARSTTCHLSAICFGFHLVLPPPTCHDRRSPSLTSVHLAGTMIQHSNSCCVIAKAEKAGCDRSPSLSLFIYLFVYL